jgi:GntR family transcriptional regulator/MocR family aminotransferase
MRRASATSDRHRGSEARRIDSCYDGPVARASRRSQKRTSSQPEILVPLDRSKGRLQLQIEDALRRAARSGQLRPSAVLPSSRLLARDLGLSRGVVVGAYEQLVAEGFLVSRPGGRTVVAPRVRSVEWRVESDAPQALRFDFKPGVPDVREFPRREWSRASRAALRAATDSDLGYGDVRGSLPLRARLAEYLGRVRAVDTVPSQVLICAGVTQALGVAVRALVASGIRCVALEDPSHPDVRRLVTAAGATVASVRVDEHGLVVRDLANSRAGAVFVTPAHQFPTGAVMSAERRRELVAWACAAGGFIVEDDYDSEYRYDSAPVGAMQGLAPDRIVYTGSASKILAPALRLGWMCLPPKLLAAAADAKRLADLGSPSIDQLVYAAFIESGGLDRHLRRTRLLYRSRRDALVRTIAAGTPWKVDGIAAGLHLVATLPSRSEERKIIEAAIARDVRLHPMAGYNYRPRPNHAALVLGYGHLTEDEIEEGLLRAIEMRGDHGSNAY